MKIIQFLFLFIIFFSGIALASEFSLKLPYERDKSYLVNQAYNVFTHKGIDLYALDFVLDGCDGFDQPVIAASSGTVIEMKNDGQHGTRDYGNYVLIDHGDNLESKYAHLNQVLVEVGDTVEQGDEIGTMGNTGFALGTACSDHPGTHLHFAVYKREKYIDAKGKEKVRKVAYKPEPMSGFTDFKKGEYYKDGDAPVDNELVSTPASVDSISQFSIDITFDGGNYSGLTVGYSGNSIIDLSSSALGSFKTDQNGDIVPKGGEVDSASNSSSQKQEELSFEKKYYAKIASTDITGVKRVEGDTLVVLPNEEADIKVGYKNMGLFDWSGKDVSLNILSSDMSVFYDGWLTKKRPVRLSQSTVKPKEVGYFSFTIKEPEQEGLYTLGVRPVIFYENSYQWLGEDAASWKIRVEKDKQDDAAGNDDAGAASAESLPPTDSGGDGTNVKNEDKPALDKKPYYGVGGSTGAAKDSDDMSSLETYLSDFPEDATNKSEIDFAFRSNFAGAQFRCRLDDDVFADCVSPIAYKDVPEGNYIFEVKAFLSGEEDRTPARHNFIIDRTAPLKIQDLEAESVVRGNANLSGTFPENVLSKVEIYYKKSENCSSENLADLKDWNEIEVPFSDQTKLKKKENNKFELTPESLEEGKNYCFAIKTEDLAGNVSEVSNAANTIVNDSADHLLLSEIKLWGEDRFVELYNPTLEDMKLSDYSLQFLKDGENKTVKINFENDDTILSHGFFLVGEADFIAGVSSDLVFSDIDIGENFTVYLAKTNSYLLDKDNNMMEADEGNIADEIKLTPVQNPDYSLERKAHQNSSSESMLILPDKYEGNGYDSDRVDDFLIRDNPQPQNSSSLKEPHKNEKPVIKIPNWNGQKYFKEEEIKLSVEVSDLEDATVPDDKISWLLDGMEIGHGMETVLNDPEIGKHDITIEATDSDGEKSSAEFSIEVAESGWKDAVKIPGSLSSYSGAYGASLDNDGNLHIAFMKESQPYSDPDGFGNSIYYQKKDGEFLDEPIQILKLRDYGIEYLSDIDLLVDNYGTVHIIFTGGNSTGENYRTYHISSLDNFKDPMLIFSGFIYPQSRIDGNFIYVAVNDGVGGSNMIYYKKFLVDENSIQLSEENSHEIENASSISRYNFAVKDGKLRFAVLYSEKNTGEAPRQFESGLPVPLVMVIPSNMAVGYLENDNGNWNFEYLESGFSISTNLYFAGEAGPYILANDYTKNLIFSRQEDAWYRKTLDMDLKYVYGFGRHVDGNLHMILSVRNNHSEILWQIHDGNNLREISLLDKVGADKNIDGATVSYFMNNQGKEGVIFGDLDESGLYELYYLERG
jgi:hypothetical protein